jgi:hypothetical protein
MQNIDKLYSDQKKDARENIKSLYTIPNALIGKDTEGNFATQKMQETFDFYNSVTEPLRQELEIELTTLFKNSVFASQITLPIEIEPLKYVSAANESDEEDNRIRKEGQAKLNSTGIGVNSFIGLQASVGTGVTQYDSGIGMAMEFYGFTEEKAIELLGEPVDLIPEDAETVDEETKTEDNETVNNE